MIDLKSRFGDVYRITLDESANIPGQTSEERLWLQRIPCRGNAHIYVHGQDTLGAFIDRKGLMPYLAKVPGVRVHQRGDNEMTVVFALESLPEVARLLGARKRRHLSPEQREALIRSGAGTRYNPGSSEPGDTGYNPDLPAPDASADGGTVDPSSEAVDRSGAP
jgi:hypothetical protein